MLREYTDLGALATDYVPLLVLVLENVPT